MISVIIIFLISFIHNNELKQAENPLILGGNLANLEGKMIENCRNSEGKLPIVDTHGFGVWSFSRLA